jgi:methylated-DNA-[protein]-cysteine S-methyltransferase
MPSPVGELTLVANDKSLIAVLWENDRPHHVRLPTLEVSRTHPVLLTAEAQLREYFDGRRKVFRLPLEFYGSDFQVKVWKALQTIPYGATRSYGELACQIGSEKACRAVGAANGRNPLPIVVPCHRVIGSNGKLTGFGGGLDVKAFLLNLERPLQ